MYWDCIQLLIFVLKNKYDLIFPPSKILPIYITSTLHLVSKDKSNKKGGEFNKVQRSFKGDL